MSRNEWTRISIQSNFLRIINKLIYTGQEWAYPISLFRLKSIKMQAYVAVPEHYACVPAKFHLDWRNFVWNIFSLIEG